MAPNQPEWTLVDFVHRGSWWRHSGILALNICLILPLMTAWSNGLDSSLVNGLQILPAWQEYFHHPQGKMLGILVFSQNIGSLIGLPFTPYLCDNWGRRPTLFIGAMILMCGVAVQATATSLTVFIVARAILGLGLTFSLAASPLLITELAYPTQRGKLSGIYNCVWYIGSIANAWSVYAVFNHLTGEWTWRIPTIVQALSPILQACLVWFIPESPRFLVSKGLESAAARVLARFHAHGDERDPLVQFELAQIRHALRAERAISQSQSLSVLWATPGNRRRMMIIVGLALFSQWSGNGLISYYSNLVYESVGLDDVGTKAALNGGLAIWNLACAMGGAMMVDKLGRRTLFLISNTGMLIVFAAWTVTEALYNTLHIKAAGKATLVMIFLFYFFYDIAYTPLLVAYSLEILPFHIRAKGFAVLNFTVAVTIAFNQFVNPWALSAIGWWYYLVYVGFLVFELFFVWKYIIETKGRTLEETAALFDGEPIELVEAAGEAATTHSAFFRGRDFEDVDALSVKRMEAAMDSVTESEERPPTGSGSGGSAAQLSAEKKRAHGAVLEHYEMSQISWNDAEVHEERRRSGRSV